MNGWIPWPPSVEGLYVLAEETSTGQSVPRLVRWPLRPLDISLSRAIWGNKITTAIWCYYLPEPPASPAWGDA